MQRALFQLCLSLGRLLRAGRYASARTVVRDGEMRVRKQRALHAPLLVGLGGPLMSILDTGVRVLPQRAWVDRERLLYRVLYDQPIQVGGDGALLLPCLRGVTLATLLDDPHLDESLRNRSIELAVIALRRFHDAGFTHADAMAENVMVDVDADAAHWFDFETVHDESRPVAWRRADDVRALLATCLLRTRRDAFATTLRLILDVYADVETARLVALHFASVSQRALPFHLAQAPLSFDDYRAIARLLDVRAAVAGDSPV